MRLLFSTFAVALAMAAPVLAQSDQARPGQPPAKPAPTTKPAQKPAPKLPVGLRLFFVVENESMSASSSFKAVTGSSSMLGFGGGGEVLNLWKHVFARVGVSSASKDGTRPQIIDGVVIDTGIPTSLGLRTVELSGGWRSYLKKHPKYAWYGGGGMLLTRLTQTSDFAQQGDDVSRVFGGYSFFGGFEAEVRKVSGKLIVAGVEAQFRSVADALGDAGTVSGSYNETNLGGFAIRGLVGIRFRR